MYTRARADSARGPRAQRSDAELRRRPLARAARAAHPAGDRREWAGLRDPAGRELRLVFL